MQQHIFTRRRLILAALVLGAAAFLGSRDGWAAPAKAGYPNPTPRRDANGNLLGNVKLTMTGTAYIDRHAFRLHRHARLVVRRPDQPDRHDVRPLPLGGWRRPQAARRRRRPSRKRLLLVFRQPFTYTATLYVNDNPNTPAYAAAGNRFWNWEVDVTNGGTTLGDVWQFRVPLESPTDQSTDVSVYSKFQWEGVPHIPGQRPRRSTFSTRTLFLIKALLPQPARSRTMR